MAGAVRPRSLRPGEGDGGDEKGETVTARPTALTRAWGDVTATRHNQGVIEPDRITMRLDPDDLRLFFKLYPALLFFVNRRLGVVEKPLSRPGQVAKLHTDE